MKSYPQTTDWCCIQCYDSNELNAQFCKHCGAPSPDLINYADSDELMPVSHKIALGSAVVCALTAAAVMWKAN